MPTPRATQCVAMSIDKPTSDFAGSVETDDRLTSGLRNAEEAQPSAWLKTLIPAPPVSAAKLTGGFNLQYE